MVMQHLKSNGIKLTRIEIGWGAIHNGLISPSVLPSIQACKKWGMRPIILLNSNSGIPCPFQGFYATLAAPALLGATTLEFVDTAGFVPGYTGISMISKYMTCEVFVTSVTGNTVTISKPLPVALSINAKVMMNTLEIKPFSVVGSPDYVQSIDGWKAYVLLVGQFCEAQLGLGNFDLEIWNETSFGSEFLWINEYYNPPVTGAPAIGNTAIEVALVQATVDVVNAHPELFSGSEVSNGFGNVMPFVASSQQPARVTGISKHLYAVGPRTYPAQDAKGASLNALLVQENPAKFVPSYSMTLPEFILTAHQTEFAIRDSSPLTTDIYGIKHGRNARSGNPCWGWCTEAGYNPKSDKVLDATQAMALKAKSTARYFCFLLNKGFKKVTLFGTGGGDLGLGLVSEAFLTYASTNTVYPSTDMTSPALKVTRNMAKVMSIALDRFLAVVRHLTVFGCGSTPDRTFSDRHP